MTRLRPEGFAGQGPHPRLVAPELSPAPAAAERRCDSLRAAALVGLVLLAAVVAVIAEMLTLSGTLRWP